MKREGDYYENRMVCDGRQTCPYLFWGEEGRAEYDTTKRFVVLGSETESFLREKLKFLGPKQGGREGFIQYQLSRMKDSPYNLTTFQREAYEETAGPHTSPKPNSILRIFTIYTPLV